VCGSKGLCFLTFRVCRTDDVCVEENVLDVIGLTRTSRKKPFRCNRITRTFKPTTENLRPSLALQPHATLASRTRCCCCRHDPLRLPIISTRTAAALCLSLPDYCLPIHRSTPLIRTRANLFMVRPVESLIAAPIPKTTTTRTTTTASSTLPPPAPLHPFAAVLSYRIITSQDESPRGSSSCRSSCSSDLRPPYVRQAILRNCCSHGNDPPSNVNAANLYPLVPVY
jgi:hypothetical protein